MAMQGHKQEARTDEAIATQLPEGTALPLVVRVVKKIRQPGHIDTEPQDVSEIKRLAREAAAAHSLPVDYFLRLIKQESGFDHRAVSRAGAQGVAQFMPGTAAVRGLKNPFDPAEALPKSAAFLSDLTRRFGNIGLAAAAYNGGPTRVANWLAGRGGLPMETRSYVLAITGKTVEYWVPTGTRLVPSDVQSAHVRTQIVKNASAYMPKNWELELLHSLNKNKSVDDASKSLAAQILVAHTSKAKLVKRMPRMSIAIAEQVLCPSCLIQSSY
ncbi:transglycosylase SLT domain-containing protein [Methylorubrum aminovorans]|nr:MULTISPECIES: transglycosylase SLT domain-containing protein [unclassified Methylobacterium]